MPAYDHKCASLPDEIWLYILEIAVESVAWPTCAFFPPSADFPCLRPIKGVSRNFHALAEDVERSVQCGSISVEHLKDALESSRRTGCVRHLMVQEYATKLKPDDYTLFASRFVNLESLSISCNDRSVLMCLQATSLAKRLRRLDLTFVDMYPFNSRLDFPNLLELRLSTMRPTKKSTIAEDFLLETTGFSLLSFDFDVMVTVFINSLSETIQNLQNLKLLSMHVALVPRQRFDYARLYHTDRHESERCDFRVCRLCPRFSEMPEMLTREVTASTRLAVNFPNLERVRWTDPWKVEYFDEECQKEYGISRRDGEAYIESSFPNKGRKLIIRDRI